MVTVMEKPFETTVAEVRQRTLDRNPVDRRAPLAIFKFGIEPKEGQPNDFYLAPFAEAKAKDAIAAALPDRIWLSELARDNIFSRTGYPQRLVESLPKGAVEFDMNYLMQFGLAERNALIRLQHGNQARAILGSGYTPLDDIELLTIVQEHVSGAIVRYEGMTEESSHISITFPEQVGQDEKGLGLQRGIHIANSEVGFRSVTIGAILWRPVCNNVLPAVGLGGSNGGIGNDGALYRRGKNSGAKAEDTNSWRFVHRGDPARLRAFVSQAITDGQRQQESLIFAWKEGLKKQIPDPINAIEKLAKGADLTQDQFKRALEAYGEAKADFGPTATGIANAFTRSAQFETNPEDKIGVELVGSRALFSLN